MLFSRGVNKCTIILSLAVLGLGAAVTQELLALKTSPGQLTVGVTRSDQIATEAVIPTFDPPGRDHFAAFTARPLFVSTRRPPVEVAKIAKPAFEPEPELKPTPAAFAVEKGEFRLAGVVVDPGQAIGLLKRAGDVRAWRLSEGSKIDGWTVVSIAPDSVTLSRNGVRNVVALRDNELSESEMRQRLGATIKPPADPSAQARVSATIRQKLLDRQMMRKRMRDKQARSRRAPDATQDQGEVLLQPDFRRQADRSSEKSY